jgi:hypothetical protein
MFGYSFSWKNDPVLSGRSLLTKTGQSVADGHAYRGCEECHRGAPFWVLPGVGPTLLPVSWASLITSGQSLRPGQRLSPFLWPAHFLNEIWKAPGKEHPSKLPHLTLCLTHPNHLLGSQGLALGLLSSLLSLDLSSAFPSHLQRPADSFLCFLFVQDKYYLLIEYLIRLTNKTCRSGTCWV